MEHKQLFLMDNKKLGRLLKVEIYTVTRIRKKRLLKKDIQKNYIITGFNRVHVDEELISEVVGEDGQNTAIKTLVKKEKFIKWGEFSFHEVMHPKDRIKEFFTKIELPLSYIPDTELVEEMHRRELIPHLHLTDETLTNETKRRGLTEFGNAFKISKNASLFQRIKARLKKQKTTPIKKLNFKETVPDLKKRKLIVPKDFITDEELLEEIKNRGILSVVPEVDNFMQDDFIFEPANIPAHADPKKDEKPIDLEVILNEIKTGSR